MTGGNPQRRRWHASNPPFLKWTGSVLLLLLVFAYFIYLRRTAQIGWISEGFHIRSGGFDWKFNDWPMLFLQWTAALLVALHFLHKWPAGLRLRNPAAQILILALAIFLVCIEPLSALLRVNVPENVYLVLLGVVSGGAAFYLRRGPGDTDALYRLGHWVTNPRGGRYLLFFAGCISAAAGWRLIFGGHALMIDSLSQISQARVLLLGDLTLDMSQRVRDVINFPSAVPTVPSYSQFPPGYLIFLTPLIALGIPVHFLNILVAGLIVLLTAAIARKIAGETAALCAGVLLAFSPFFIGLAGSAMNHAASCLALLTAAYCFLPAGPVRSPGAQRSLYLLGGIMLGWTATIRPLTALAHGLTWSIVWLAIIRGNYDKSKHSQVPSSRPERNLSYLMRSLGLAGIGIIPPMLFLLYYNSQTTGNPFTLAYQANNPELHRLGFSYDGPEIYTPLHAIENFAADLIAFNFQLFGWLTGSWVLLLVWWVHTRLSRGERIMILLICMQAFLYSLYSYHHLVLGPRFQFDVLPCWAILAGIGLAPVLRRGGRLAGATAILILLLSLGGAVKGIQRNAQEFGIGVARHDRIRNFMRSLMPLDQPTVVVFDHGFIDNFGAYFPHAPGEPEIWFVSERDEVRARQEPELAQCRWVRLRMSD